MASAIDIQAIDHINLSVCDLDRSMAFYQSVFGFRLAEDGRIRLHDDDSEVPIYAPRSYVILIRHRVAALALHHFSPVNSDTVKPDRQPSQRINHWGFVVHRFDDAVKQLHGLKVEIHPSDGRRDGVIQYPGSRSVYVSDPDGHDIELVERFAGGLN